MQTKYNLIFYPDNHTYIIRDDDNVCDKQLISVTQLMSAIGVSPDYSDVPQKTLSKKATHGTKVHAQIQQLINTTDTQCNSEVMLCDGNIVAGTIDIITNNGDIYDIKTTSTKHLDAWEWQLGFYRYLVSADIGLTGTKYGVIWIPNPNKITVIPITPRPLNDIKKAISCYFNKQQWAEDTNRKKDIIAENKSLYDSLAELVTHKQQLKQQIIDVDAQITQIAQTITPILHDNNIYNISHNNLTITRIQESSRTTIDAKALRKDHPDIYTTYAKITTIPETIKLTIKDDNA